MTNPTRPGPMPEHAPTKENAPNPEGEGGEKSKIIKPHDTNPDPLSGWFSLGASVKTSRNRRQKRGWNWGRK